MEKIVKSGIIYSDLVKYFDFDLKDILFDEIIEELEMRDGKDEKYSKPNNLYNLVNVVKECECSLDKFKCYKKIIKIKGLENSYDADCSKYVMEVYKKLFFDNKGDILYQAQLSSGEVNRIGFKHEIVINDVKYIGETMNSFQTILSLIKKYENEKNKSSENIDKLNITKEMKEKFARLTHNIGNFMPVIADKFNGARYNITSDYWDLTLYGIKEYYTNNITAMTSVLNNCKSWLDEYDDFNDFINKNYLSEYVSSDDIIDLTSKDKGSILEQKNETFSDKETKYDCTIEIYVAERRNLDIDCINNFLENVCDIIESRKDAMREKFNGE